MDFTFNLIDQPWIPAIQLDGQPLELGLRDTLARAHRLRELRGETPPETAALHRLLLAVLHRVFGPAGYAAWGALWEAKQWDVSRLDAYIEQWRDRFDLFDAEYPFYQAADERVKSKSVISLISHMASGNNATLFDHHTEAVGASLTAAQAARAVVTAQAFGLAGLSGLPQKFTDGSCTRGVIFLVTGDTLFETLALNLVRYPAERTSSIADTSKDRPAWEMDDPHSDRMTPLGYLDYLTWQNRKLLLTPEKTPTGVVVRQMTMAPGLRLNPDILDPMKHYRIDKKRGYLVQRFLEHRALWRDSAALFRLSKGANARPPYTFRWLSELVSDYDYIEHTDIYHYLALGMASKQAKVEFYRAEQMPMPLDYLRNDRLVERLMQALEWAENARNQLWWANRALAKFMLAPEADKEGARQPAREDLDSLTNHWNVERHYWSRLELPFRELVMKLPDDTETPMLEWRQLLTRVVWQALDHAITLAGDSTRALKAGVQARRQLAGGLANVLPKLEQEVISA